MAHGGGKGCIRFGTEIPQLFLAAPGASLELDVRVTMQSVFHLNPSRGRAWFVPYYFTIALITSGIVVAPKAIC